MVRWPSGLQTLTANICPDIWANNEVVVELAGLCVLYKVGYLMER